MGRVGQRQDDGTSIPRPQAARDGVRSHPAVAEALRMDPDPLRRAPVRARHQGHGQAADLHHEKGKVHGVRRGSSDAAQAEGLGGEHGGRAGVGGEVAAGLEARWAVDAG